MPDLSTTYLGLPLPHPIVASAGPIAHTLDGIRRLEDGGAAAIVLPSLFEEQIERENEALTRLMAEGADSTGEASSYFPSMGEVAAGSGAYLDLVRRARERVQVPIIASLNGATTDGWVDYARQVHEAGAHAIELNLFHIPADPMATGRAVEQRYEDVVRAVCAAVPMPVAVKIGPYFSAMGEMAARLVAAGARGLVLFNRFYQPDFDLDRMEVAPTLDLSSPAEIRLPLLWLAVLHGRLDVLAGRHDRRALARRSGQVHPGRRRRGDVDVGGAQARPGAPRRDPQADSRRGWRRRGSRRSRRSGER